jgi:hypothetical protein
MSRNQPTEFNAAGGPNVSTFAIERPVRYQTKKAKVTSAPTLHVRLFHSDSRP